MIRPRTAATRTAALALLPFLPVLSAHASDPYLLTIQPGSSLNSNTSIFAPSTGTLIGDYDATSNPTGTRTLPGLFGGSGNNPIPLSLDIELGGDNTTSPAGSITFLANPGAGTFAIAALSIDLLDETIIELPITAAIEYSTFRTVSPSFLYLGGIPLTIPLGNAELILLSATLGDTPSGGTLTPNGDGSYTLAGIATLNVAVQARVLEEVIDGGVVPIAAPVGGTFTPAPDGLSASLTLSLDISNSSEVPGPFPAVENIPFDLPTLNPDAPAHVLLTLEFQRIDIAIGGSVSGIASGPLACRADFNLDGVPDILDFLDFFASFGECQLQPAPCPNPLRDADFNSDGFVDILDFLDFLQAFSDGCP